ncbi:MFS transporter [Sutcliffiella horikoshii]|uniref:MFS transporter n=1 Tax=Sutcliffiella horikoshii TaxID=79883 RepID=A0A5D4T7Y1_9BACI|nr:MFS transporter [Sutcliffiella horikoshii]TYS71770.1 MFS transporter [Sutcliffiella horikoshii]
MEQIAALEINRPTLSRRTKILLVISCLNTLANSLSNVFVNVFLFKVTEQFDKVVLFNLVMYLSWLPAFVLAGWISKKVSKRNGLIIGGLFQLLFYLFILYLKESDTSSIIMLGILFGIGSGFYWMAVNTLSIDYTSEQNRDWFNGVNGVFNSFSQMLGPLAASWVIITYTNLNGYYLVFSLAAIIFLFTFILSLLLPKHKQNAPFYWKEMISVHKYKEWRALTYAFTANAFRAGVLSFAIILWVFMLTEKESIIGGFSFITTVLSVFTYYFIGKYSTGQIRMRLMIIGNLFLSLSLFGLVLEVNWTTLLVYGIISGICLPLFELPFHTLALNNISTYDLKGKIRIELVVVREVALSIGRTFSVFLLFLLYFYFEDNVWMLRAFLIIIIAIGLLPHYFLKQVNRSFIQR